jgi:NAD(P)H-hydrate epimerase
MTVNKVKKEIIKKVYPARPKNSKKYDFGFLTIIGGSDLYSGSPALSALSALRSGVDMTRIIAPKRAADIMASFSPNLVAYPLVGDKISKEHLATLITLTEAAKTVSYGKTAVVIGGGLGRSLETQEAILEYLSQIDVPIVVDADAIHAVSKNKEVLSGKKFIMTPHSYEFFITTGINISSLSQKEKERIVLEEANRLKGIIILKGNIDIISDGKEVVINKTGNPSMTVGGTGDVLTGICGALLARGVDPFLSAQAATFINGSAADIAVKEFGEGMLATDVINNIPKALL